MLSKIKTLPLVIGIILCLILTFICHVMMENQEVVYEEVTATVVDAEDRTKIAGGMTRNYYYVTVRYEGEIYELHNVGNSYASRHSYTPGQPTKVYFSNGAMYANETGVQTSTLFFRARLGFFAAAFMLSVTLFCQKTGILDR